MKPLRLDDLPGGLSTLILCATPRLAQSLRSRHATLTPCLTHGARQALNCLTIEQWLASWREAWLLTGHPVDPALLHRALSAQQERLLWEQVIRQSLGDAEATRLFDLPALAQTAQEAHQLQTVWRVPVPCALSTEEHQQFQRWQATFTSWCQAHGWATRHELDGRTVQALAGPVPGLLWPQLVVLAGFNRINPLEQSLLDRLPATGVTVGQLDNALPETHQTLLRYPDAAVECRAAAAWVRQHRAARPDARLAVVVPDLAAQRQQLHDALEDALAPWLALPESAERQRPFNISLGRPLSDHALVGVALALLSSLAHTEPIAQQDLSPVLLSPYWGGADTAPMRAQIDAAMRQQLPAQIRWAQVADRVDGADLAPHDTGIPAWLHTLSTLPANLPRRQLPSAWSAWIPDTLRAVGWLARRRLSSHEYQQHDTLLECLAELARMDAFTGPIPLSEALQRLRQLCRERVFQPETEGHPTIEVLGLLEASGQQFDAVWVMGMDAGTWPPPIRPNPLLPVDAQRQTRCPNASAEVQLSFARQVHTQLSQSAPEVVWSWPHRLRSAELQLSPLLANERVNGLTPQLVDDPPVTHWAHDALSTERDRLAPLVDDTRAPAVAPDERVPGGTALLKAQAICPAWAYYRFRLGARPLDEAVDGLDARQRGTLLHAALECLWRDLGTSARLQALDATQTEQAIKQAIAAAWARRDADQAPDTLEPRTRALESRRLHRLLAVWLSAERARPDAFTVVATEQREAIDCQGLNIRVQIDRIDQMEDGTRVIIDYKTGSRVDTNNWASDRLTEPQLPLYATWRTSQGDPVAAVAFAKVVLREPEWAGLADADQRLPGVPSLQARNTRKRYPAERFPDWASVLQHWKTALDTVAREILAGETAVRVADEKALTYCEVLPLLRLSERRQQWLERPGHDT